MIFMRSVDHDHVHRLSVLIKAELEMSNIQSEKITEELETGQMFWQSVEELEEEKRAMQCIGCNEMEIEDATSKSSGCATGNTHKKGEGNRKNRS